MTILKKFPIGIFNIDVIGNLWITILKKFPVGIMMHPRRRRVVP
jgi:hypothetical protein